MKELSNPGFTVEDWGVIPYQEAFERQAQYVDEIISGVRPETLVFCTHPPVVTLGRGTQPGDVFAWDGETVSVNRGGRATYHGPSQMVFYPLIYIGDPVELYVSKKLKPKDLHEFFRIIEQSMVNVLKNFNVQAQGHSLQTPVGEEQAQEATGVWVNDKKIASIGIAVRKWVSSHGAAINLLKDPTAFTGLNPCGFKSEKMVSLEELTIQKVKPEDFKKLWLDEFLSLILRK